jgi:hypothetical protein
VPEYLDAPEYLSSATEIPPLAAARSCNWHEDAAVGNVTYVVVGWSTVYSTGLRSWMYRYVQGRRRRDALPGIDEGPRLFLFCRHIRQSNETGQWV